MTKNVVPDEEGMVKNGFETTRHEKTVCEREVAYLGLILTDPFCMRRIVNLPDGCLR